MSEACPACAAKLDEAGRCPACAGKRTSPSAPPFPTLVVGVLALDLQLGLTFGVWGLWLVASGVEVVNRVRPLEGGGVIDGPWAIAAGVGLWAIAALHAGASVGLIRRTRRGWLAGAVCAVVDLALGPLLIVLGATLPASHLGGEWGRAMSDSFHGFMQVAGGGLIVVSAAASWVLARRATRDALTG